MGLECFHDALIVITPVWLQTLQTRACNKGQNKQFVLKWVPCTAHASHFNTNWLFWPLFKAPLVQLGLAHSCVGSLVAHMTKICVHAVPVHGM